MKGVIASACACVAVYVAGLPHARAAGETRQAQTLEARCADFVKQVDAVKQEIDDINLERPPWDKKPAEERRTNINYRLDEIHNLEGRRSAAGCPGAQPLTPPPASGGTTAAKPGTLSATEFVNRFVALCMSLPKSEHDTETCHYELDEDNWGDLTIDGGVRSTQEDLARSELSEKLNINGTPATAGEGVDIGTIATIVWKRDGHTFLSSFEHSERREDVSDHARWEYARNEAFRYAKRLDDALR